MSTSPSDFTEILAARLRAVRFDLSLTQEEMADKLGCSRRTLQSYESGLAIPSPKRRRRILAFLAKHEQKQEAVA